MFLFEIYAKNGMTTKPEKFGGPQKTNLGPISEVRPTG
jgi:hypothetical protein